jgi:hypothetical protein
VSQVPAEPPLSSITGHAARVMLRRVEHMLKVRAAPAASFEELDQAIDEVRSAWDRFTVLVLRAAAAATHGEPANDDDAEAAI